jgi:predicted dehydrogenase
VPVSVGFIGYRNHAGRLRAITESNKMASIGAVYYPKLLEPEIGATTSFEKLLDQDAIVIASPSDSHYAYLKKLSETGYTGYIFCEKPIVTSRQDLDALDHLNLDLRKIFVNFNYRFSRFAKMASEAIKAATLGEPIHFQAVSTQGLAFSSKYRDSWRSDRSRHPLGITETKAIHYLDLAISLFGNPTAVDYQPRVISGNGTAVDTSTLSLSFDDGKSANIFVSYAAPFRHTIELTGVNGYLIYDSGSIRLHSPRDTFSKHGRFESPPILSNYSYHESGTDFHTESLWTAIDHFLEVCASSGSFPKSEMDSVYETTSVLLGLNV